MLPIWLLAAMMIVMYYWRFWEPCANAMLVVALVSQHFRQRALRVRVLAENDSFPVVSSPFWGRSPRAWPNCFPRKRCETKATTNIAFAQGSQNLQ